MFVNAVHERHGTIGSLGSKVQITHHHPHAPPKGEGMKDRIGKSGEEMTHQTRGYPRKRTLGTERMFHVETRRTLRNPEKL